MSIKYFSDLQVGDWVTDRQVVAKIVNIKGGYYHLETPEGRRIKVTVQTGKEYGCQTYWGVCGKDATKEDADRVLAGIRETRARKIAERNAREEARRTRENRAIASARQMNPVAKYEPLFKDLYKMVFVDSKGRELFATFTIEHGQRFIFGASALQPGVRLSNMQVYQPSDYEDGYQTASYSNMNWEDSIDNALYSLISTFHAV